MKEVYLLSGLGADERVFGFLDLSDFKVNFIDWIDPLSEETIERYAQRLLQQIPTDKPTLIGVSFGGIMAIEIGKLIETEKIILISSAKTKRDIPLSYKIIGQFRMHRLIPATLLKKVNPLTFWFFGTETKKERDLLKTIMGETDNTFLKWAIHKIVNWKNTAQLKNVSLIHGTADRILPGRSADFEITDGGHLMIVNKAEHVSLLIKNILT